MDSSADEGELSEFLTRQQGGHKPMAEGAASGPTVQRCKMFLLSGHRIKGLHQACQDNGEEGTPGRAPSDSSPKATFTTPGHWPAE